MGEALLYWTARAAMLLYCGGAALRISGQNSTARTAWTAGALATAAHLASAFDSVHDWSHASAAAEITRRTAADVGVQWGGGIYVNYAFAAVWAADAAWWCARPQSYVTRPRWVEGAVQTFLAFIAFNATVVFAAGPVRWAGIAATGIILFLLVRRASGGSRTCVTTH